MGTNKTQLLHRIRLRKCTPQAPFADNFVSETEWQKEDTLVSQDDLYAHAWGSNFGSSPFDPDHGNCDQQEDTVEYEPTSQPKIYRPPSLDNSKNSGGIPARQPAVNVKEPQITEKSSSENENHEPIPETSRNPEDTRENPTQNSPKSPETNTENDAQEAEETVNTRGEKYNLRPNPNPNYSDSYCY